MGGSVGEQAGLPDAALTREQHAVGRTAGCGGDGRVEPSRFGGAADGGDGSADSGSGPHAHSLDG